MVVYNHKEITKMTKKELEARLENVVAELGLLGFTIDFGCITDDDKAGELVCESIWEAERLVTLALNRLNEEKE